MNNYDFLNQSSDSAFGNKISQEKKLFRDLLLEEESIFQKIRELSQNVHSVERLKDFLEALSTELKIRKIEKLAILEKILQREDDYQQQLKNYELQTETENLKIKKFKMAQNQRRCRQIGQVIMRPNESIKDSDVYDWIIDITLLTHISTVGWKVVFNKQTDKNFGDILDKHQQSFIKNSLHADNSNSNIYDEYQIKQQQVLHQQEINGENKKDDDNSWDGAIVAVVGLYDKGKTFLLNNLTTTNLPSGKKFTTQGLSFKQVDIDFGTKLILLDTAGSYSPVQNEFSVIEKEATEFFMLDLVFDLSDYFLCVVNDFTSLDQRYLEKLQRNLQNSPNKIFREIIVVHNLKEVESREVLDHLWNTQVTQIYSTGSVQKTKVAAINPITGNLQEKHVAWFKTQYSRHICLANDDSEIGSQLNPWAFSLLRYWLKVLQINQQKGSFCSSKSQIFCS